MKLDKREEEYGNYDAADEKSTEPVEVCRNRRRLPGRYGGSNWMWRDTGTGS